MKGDGSYFVVSQIIPRGMRLIEDFRGKKEFIFEEIVHT